jgi:hypothetical protein
MPFKEALPAGCPPQHAVDREIPEAYRMVFSSPPTPDDFRSKMALGCDLYAGTDPCCFASCSLHRKALNAIKLARLPKPREKGAMVAKISIPAGAGKWVENKKKHIDFWMYAEFSPAEAFVEMVDF